jgi:hypothetical protein
MLKKISLLVAIATALFVVIVAMQPSEFKVSRSIVIAAPAATIFPHVNTLRQWDAWSPWAKLDPNANTSFKGADEGVGAIMRWSGNRDIGVGNMEITQSKPDQLVEFRLNFTEPMEGTNTATFVFEPTQTNSTKVTWTMEGTNHFIAKAIGLVFDCEKMVGEQFDKGLASLKTIAETPQ